MKLYKIILGGIIGMTLGEILTNLIWPESFDFVGLFTRTWFLIIGIMGGWYFKPKHGA